MECDAKRRGRRSSTAGRQKASQSSDVDNLEEDEDEEDLITVFQILIYPASKLLRRWIGLGGTWPDPVHQSLPT